MRREGKVVWRGNVPELGGGEARGLDCGGGVEGGNKMLGGVGGKLCKLDQEEGLGE